MPSFDFDHFGRIVATSIRMLDNVLDVTAWPLEQQRKEAMAKRRVGLGFTGLGDALIMLRLRYDTEEARADGRADLREHARPRLHRLGRAGEGARRVPAVQRRPLPVRHQLRLASAVVESRKSIQQARHPQLPPAVDRADRHHQPRLRRQRVERHRAAVLLDLHAQEAHGRRLAGILGRGPRVSPLPRDGRKHGRAARPISSPRWKSARRRTSRWSRPWRRSSTPASPRR